MSANTLITLVFLEVVRFTSDPCELLGPDQMFDAGIGTDMFLILDRKSEPERWTILARRSIHPKNARARTVRLPSISKLCSGIYQSFLAVNDCPKVESMSVERAKSLLVFQYFRIYLGRLRTWLLWPWRLWRHVFHEQFWVVRRSTDILRPRSRSLVASQPRQGNNQGLNAFANQITPVRMLAACFLYLKLTEDKK